MFDLGAKVTVLASTQKTGAGPRKGSIGHIVGIEDGYLIDQTMFSTSCTVHFNRFGFEQKPRSETRTVMNLLHLINNSGEADIPKQINTFHTFFNSAKFDEVIPRILDPIQANISTPIVVMAPYNEIDDDMLTCSNLEFELWAKAIFLIISPTLYQMTVADNNMYTRNPYISKKKILGLNNVLGSRENKDLYIGKMLSFPEERRDFILMIRYLLSIQNCSSHRIKHKAAKDLIRHELHNTYSNGRPTFDTVKMIYRILYNNLHSVSFKHVAALFEERPSKECIKNTTLMKSELKSMSEKLLSENTSN